MNAELRNIISDFQAKVDEANELLKKHLNTNEPHNRSPSIEQIGLLGGKHNYYFHGSGCVVHISEKDVINFDYGPNGRIDGFDEWKLYGFVSTRKSRYPSVNEGDIKEWFREAIETNEIQKMNSREYGDLYYLLSNT